MTVYEKLLQEAYGEGISIDENCPFQCVLLGLYVDKNTDLSDRLSTSAKKADVLAEELGHYRTTVGNILDQSNTGNRKQERAARLWAYNKLIGLASIIKGYQARCQNRHELAEYLEVTEEFLQEALDCYREKYGIHVSTDNYIITFEPLLSVSEKF